jgi:hypothetical protein
MMREFAALSKACCSRFIFVEIPPYVVASGSISSMPIIYAKSISGSRN